MPDRNAPRPSSTEENVAHYRSYDAPLWPAERLVLDRFLRPGMRVLDLGCGTGRLVPHLVERGMDVVAVDLNVAGLGEVPRTDGRVLVAGADARRLPVRDASVDAVVFAYNGIDMLATDEERLASIAETARVLVPGGVFAFSSRNPAGMALSPRGLRSASGRRQRWRYLRRTRPFRGGYVADYDGLSMHQATPAATRREVEAAGFRFAGLWATRSGRPGAAASLLSAWPTYVFTKAP